MLKVKVLMDYVKREVENRERTADLILKKKEATSQYRDKALERGSDSTRSLNTAASAVAFHTANAEETTCIFCHRNDHQSKDCSQFTVEIRRDKLKRMGQCYVCLGDKHLTRNCRAQGVTCSECVHRHHKTV